MSNISLVTERKYQKLLKTDSKIEYAYHMSYNMSNKILFMVAFLIFMVSGFLIFSDFMLESLFIFLCNLIISFLYFNSQTIIVTAEKLYICKPFSNKITYEIELNQIFSVGYYKNRSVAISLNDGTNRIFKVNISKDEFLELDTVIIEHVEQREHRGITQQD